MFYTVSYILSVFYSLVQKDILVLKANNKKQQDELRPSLATS